MGWLVALSMLLNAAWILSIRAGWPTFSVLVIAALIATRVVVFVRLTRSRPSLWVEAVLPDGTMGLYPGWVAIATVANIAAALYAAGVAGLGLGANVRAVIVLAAAGAVGVVWRSPVGVGLPWLPRSAGAWWGSRSPVVAATRCPPLPQSPLCWQRRPRWEALPFCAMTTPHQLLRSIREPDLGCQRTDRA